MSGTNELWGLRTDPARSFCASARARAGSKRWLKITSLASRLCICAVTSSVPSRRSWSPSAVGRLSAIPFRPSRRNSSISIR